ncbi:hypothetical protein ES705_27351 [subsurface metagenome]
MTAQTKVVATQQKAVVKWKGEQITVSFHDVKTLICPYATDQETAVFLKTCQSLQLNPFAKEIYLIKYGERDKAATVIAIDSYLKSAETNDSFAGFEAGIVLRDSGGKLEFREGALILPDEEEKLVGGWARVYRKDREKPFYMSVNKAECVRYTKDGKLTRFWTKEKQPMMLRKTALKRALVEAFASLFAGTMSNVETDYEVMPEEVKEAVPKPRGETPEGELPPAYERNGEAYWKKFWARVKSELGLTTEEAHRLLQVDSIKEELINQGWTPEQVWDELVMALKKKATDVEPEQAQVVDVKTGEITAPEEDLFGEEEKTGVAAPAEAEIEQPTGTAQAKPKRDPSTLKNANDLLKACNQDFKMQPKQVYNELNISGPKEIADPAEAYQRIAAARG